MVHKLPGTVTFLSSLVGCDVLFLLAMPRRPLLDFGGLATHFNDLCRPQNGLQKWLEETSNCFCGPVWSSYSPKRLGFRLRATWERTLSMLNASGILPIRSHPDAMSQPTWHDFAAFWRVRTHTLKNTQLLYNNDLTQCCNNLEVNSFVHSWHGISS